MTRKNRYSAVIVATLLACSPIVVNNMIHNNINHIVQAAESKDENIETAYAITSKYDEDMHTKIKWNKDLTNSDINDYFDKHSHIYVNGNIKGKYIDDDDDFDSQKKQDELGYADESYSINTSISNEKGQNVSVSDNSPMLLKPGYKIYVSKSMESEGLPDKWYTWKQDPKRIGYKEDYDAIEVANKLLADDGGIPEEIKKRIHRRVENGNIILTEKTDDKGCFPEISQYKKGKNSTPITLDLGAEQMAPVATFTISTDDDAFEIPHDPTVIGKPADIIHGQPIENVVPDTDEKDNANNQIADDNDSTSTFWETSPVEDPDFNNIPVNNDPKETSVASPKQDEKTIETMAIHNALVYDKDGNVVTFQYGDERSLEVVKNKGDYLLVPANSKIKILDNGKIYTIKGKQYYRIGDNQYIKVANTTKKKVIQKVNTRGTIKASKHSQVKLFNAKGKYTKKYLTKDKKVKFDQKKYIKGQLYYRIKGTKSWVKALSIKFVKASKH